MEEKCCRRECDNPSNKPHTCPFAVEVYESYTKCTCCDSCTIECARDI